MTTGVARELEQQYKSDSVPLPTADVWIKIGIVTALIYALFWDVLLDMAHDWWNEPAYSQGMLLPPLALYVAWLHRRQTFGYTAKPDARGLLFTAFACCTFVLGNVASEFFMMRFS